MDIQLRKNLHGSTLAAWNSLLAKTGLKAEQAPETTVLIWDDEDLIATGSRQDNVLKYIAVDPAHQGEGLLASVVSSLRQDAFGAGISHLFLYTKPENRELFTSLFFYPIACSENVLLMEDRKDGILEHIACVPQAPDSENGAIVMNCNPFTKGHLYLIETAAQECSHLYVFILSEDKSRFSATGRLEMARLATAHLNNVTVLPSGPYMISSATFPTYFLKENLNAGAVQCLLDIEIFTRYYAPRLNITKRFVGTEPNCAVTNAYNEALQQYLPQRGIALRQISRVAHDGAPISASAVRAAIDRGDWDFVERVVPQTTLHYLKTGGK